MWSPNGARMMLVSESEASAYREIHVTNLDGTGEVRYTSGNFDRRPSRSPGGKKIVFSRRGSETGQTEIFRGGVDPDWGPISDMVRPTVTSITPAPGSSAGDRTPTTSAIVRDDRAY
ncbi:hypothetical protein GBA65_12865 [Rubrobacter marinus]|uniref:WD40-like Beta Propeller Repeat n=1 Tax=Rubrobacter marinus TaxID=2653852 RepID=A0A6G8PYI7_9ACTN|nr:hypothetical protein GBA65_12865 [Rubrobacter marinus]